MLGSFGSKASLAGGVAPAPLPLQVQMAGRKAAGRIRQLVAAIGCNLAGTNLERSTAASILVTGTVADYSRIDHCIGN